MNSADLRSLLREHPGATTPEACEQEAREIERALALLKDLPEIIPAPQTWTRIESKLPRRPARVFAFWLRAAAAASILAAAASFVALFTLGRTMDRTSALPVVVGTSKALQWNDRFTADAFTTLAIPDVGTLKANHGAVLRFDHPRRVILERGEIFADILPTGKGFEIQSGDQVVRVTGTKFGVTAPATVYVVEGSVEVRSPRGHVTVRPRQTSVESRLVDLGPVDPLAWLGRHERPAVRLTLDPRDQTILTSGAPLKWHLTLETDALAPLTLGRPRDVSQFISLLVGNVAVPIDAACVSLKEAAPFANGLVRLDVSHKVVIELSVDPALFRAKGRHDVRAVFTSGTTAPDPVWVGTLRSPSIPVEVR